MARPELLSVNLRFRAAFPPLGFIQHLLHQRRTSVTSPFLRRFFTRDRTRDALVVHDRVQLLLEAMPHGVSCIAVDVRAGIHLAIGPDAGHILGNHAIPLQDFAAVAIRRAHLDASWARRRHLGADLSVNEQREQAGIKACQLLHFTGCERLVIHVQSYEHFVGFLGPGTHGQDFRMLVNTLPGTDDQAPRSQRRRFVQNAEPLVGGEGGLTWRHTV